jgi:hypothetical protein
MSQVRNTTYPFDILEHTFKLMILFSKRIIEESQIKYKQEQYR